MVEHSPAGRRALIVEDETVFAMGLAVDMQALGFLAVPLPFKPERAEQTLAPAARLTV